MKQDICLRVNGVEKAEANRLLHPQAVRRLLRHKKIAYMYIHARARFSVSMAKGGHQNEQRAIY
jgi:hypothetical protein